MTSRLNNQKGLHVFDVHKKTPILQPPPPPQHPLSAKLNNRSIV